MGKTILSRLAENEELLDRIIAGEFPARSPLGPGVVQSKNIRARAVTAPLINVNNLEAVNTQTGNLSVDGAIDVSTGGRIVSGTSTDDWATFATSPGGGLGYFMEYEATLGARMGVGDFNNVTGQYIKWDGTTLTVKGSIVASAGSIAGWTILSTALTSPSAAVGLSSAGTYAIWAGDTVASSAEFSVTHAGDLVATSATITGAITASSGSITGVLTVGGAGGLNLSNNSAKIYSGQSTVNTGTGFHLGRVGGTGVFSVGNGSTAAIYFDGSSLTVSGALTATSGAFTGSVTFGASGTGSLSSGQSAYDTGTGFWLERNSGTPRFSIGNSAGNKLTWNGTTLAITGTITSTAGSIGGWTIDASGIRLGSTTTTRGLDTGSTAFFAGNATPGSAPFRVTTAGALTATSATITGAITATSGSLSGLSVSGTITIGSGGSIVDADGSTWSQTGIILVSAGTFGDAIKWQQGGSDTGSVYATTSAMVMRGDPSTGATVELFPSEAILRYNGTQTSLQLQSTNRRALFGGYIYPGTGGGTQTTRYIYDDGISISLEGPITFQNVTQAGVASNWSAGSPSGAAYFTMYVNGVQRRIPYWLDA